MKPCLLLLNFRTFLTETFLFQQSLIQLHRRRLLQAVQQGLQLLLELVLKELRLDGILYLVVSVRNSFPVGKYMGSGSTFGHSQRKSTIELLSFASDFFQFLVRHLELGVEASPQPFLLFLLQVNPFKFMLNILFDDFVPLLNDFFHKVRLN